MTTTTTTTTTTSELPLSAVGCWEDGTNKPTDSSVEENSSPTPSRSFPLRPSFDDSSAIDANDHLARKTRYDGWRSPRTVTAPLCEDGMPSSSTPTTTTVTTPAVVTGQRRSFLRQSSTAESQDATTEELPPIFQVYYQSSRWAMMLQPTQLQHQQQQQQTFQVCPCTFLLVERVTSKRNRSAPANSLAEWPAAQESNPKIDSSSSKAISYPFAIIKNNVSLQQQQQQHQQEQHVLIVAELPGVEEAQPNRNSSCSVWALNWAREALAQEFSAVYVLQQLPNALAKPTNHSIAKADKDQELSKYMRWRHLVQETLEQPMILREGSSGDWVSLKPTDDPSQLVPLEGNNSNHHMILSQPFQIRGWDGTVAVEGSAVTEPAQTQDKDKSNDETNQKRPETGNGGLMTILTEDGAISNLARASVILHLCCSDHVTMHDAHRHETLARLYRQLVQHALLLRQTTSKGGVIAQRKLNDLENTLDGLGKISWVLLQAGQQHYVSLRQDQLEQQGDASLIRVFQENGEYQIGAVPMTLQEYFAARFLVRNVGTRDLASLDFVFRQDMVARHSGGGLFAYIAGEASRRLGLEGMRSLIALCRQGARDVVGAFQLRLELQLLHEWLKIGTEEGLSQLEAEFHMLESFQQWFNAGVAYLRKGRGQEPSRCLLFFLIAALRASSTILRHLSGCMDPVLKACEDENESVRQIASDILCEIAKLGSTFETDRVTVLMDLCKKDQSENVRLAATIALAEVVKASPELAAECLPSILEACKDRSGLVRKAASTSLAKVAVVNPLQCVNVISSVCKLDKNEFAREPAARALGKIATTTPNLSERCMSPLLHVTKQDRSDSVRATATSALAEVALAHPKVTAKCLRAISDLCKHDDSESVRHAATVATADLAKSTRRFAATCLWSLWDAGKDDSASVRRAAINAFGGVAKANPDFAARCFCFISDACLEDSNASVRKAAAFALGEIAKTNKAIASKCRRTLTDAVRKDNTEMVRKAAVYALGQAAASNSEIATKCLAVLLNTYLEDQYPAVRKAAGRAMGKYFEVSEQPLPSLFKHSLRNDCKVRRSGCFSDISATTTPEKPDHILFPKDADQETVESNCGGNKVSRAVVNKSLVPHPEVAAHCISVLLDGYKTAECSDSRKASKYFLGEVAKMAHAQQHVPLLLQATVGHQDDKSHELGEPVSYALRGLSIEKLVAGYCSTQDDALLPYIAEHYFHSPIFTYTNYDDQQCLALYNSTGQRVEWKESSDQNVQKLVAKMDGYFFQKTCQQGADGGDVCEQEEEL